MISAAIAQTKSVKIWLFCIKQLWYYTTWCESSAG